MFQALVMDEMVPSHLICLERKNYRIRDQQPMMTNSIAYLIAC